MQTLEKTLVRNAAKLAVLYWPNAHLGDFSRREDLRSAFSRIRSRLNQGYDLLTAAVAVEQDAYRHANI